jgi:hypothetical protein
MTTPKKEKPPSFLTAVILSAYEAYHQFAYGFGSYILAGLQLSVPPLVENIADELCFNRLKGDFLLSARILLHSIGNIGKSENQRINGGVGIIIVVAPLLIQAVYERSDIVIIKFNLHIAPQQ